MEKVIKTREVKIGSVKLGGNAPLVIQSMTNTDTNDIEATVDQCIRIFEKGADMVRITTQSSREVNSLIKIRRILKEKGFTQPLVADVHFLPAVAEEAAKIVEKVRINPGNYISGKYKGPDKYDPGVRKSHIQKIREKLIPLIRICKDHGTAIRIGVNHGSLSERILNWYGDTPEGMVESAIEFLRVFRQENFHDLVVSLKASSGRIMVQANRLMVKRMQEEKLIYPLHLGVTEAGDEEEGRIKSSVGIGSLLADGIGDTIRVSLTEDPWEEIPVAILIKEVFGKKEKQKIPFIYKNSSFDPFHFNKRNSLTVDKVGGDNAPVVISSYAPESQDEDLLSSFGYFWKNGILEIKSTASDFIYGAEEVPGIQDIKGLQLLTEASLKTPMNTAGPVILDIKDYEARDDKYKVVFLRIKSEEDINRLRKLKETSRVVLVFDPGEKEFIQSGREFFNLLKTWRLKIPVVLYRKYRSKNIEELMIRASGEMGALLIDGLGDGVWLEDSNPNISLQETRELSFGILQATGARVSKTEYIACPSCGRTLFDIQPTLKKIKAATAEFTGLKIAVMGCIVNGPGEMADADFGYVGAGRGKISLYKGKKAVKKNIPEKQAVEELLKLIHEKNYRHRST